AGGGGTGGEAEVYREAIHAEGGDALFGRDEIAEEGGGGGAIELRAHAGENGADDDGGKRARLRERHHHDRRAEHGHRDRVAAPDAVGEMTAEHRRDEMSRAVCADREPRLRRGV